MSYLDRLEKVEEQLPVLLDDVAEWQTLDVDYEPPRVERVWRQVGDLRVCLHRIHPCDKALMHPHPWPSAMRVVQGSYVMVLGDGGVDGLAGIQGYHKVATVVLSAGSTYEMVDVHGWHSVRPLWGVAYSLMIMGPKYPEQAFDHKEFGQGRTFKGLPDEARDEIMDVFRAWAAKRR